MRGFFVEGEKSWLELGEVERALLASLLGQVVQLLDLQEAASSDPFDFLNDLGKKAERPQDEVVFRLLPDAYSEDDEANNDFRKFTEQSLREEKITRAKAVLAQLPKTDDPIEIAPDTVAAWLKSLNDVRLALGTRLEITEDFLPINKEDEEKLSLLEVYDWLTWLQGTILEIA